MLLRERSERENFYISPGPFIGPVEIRGKKNKKNDELIVSLNTLNPNHRYRLTHTASISTS